MTDRSDAAERAPAETREPLRVHVVRWLSLWAVFAVLWFPLTTPTYLELYLVGAAAAALAATAMNALRARGELRLAPDVRWPLRAWRLPWAVVGDAATVLAAAWRRGVLGQDVRGVYRGARFEHGGDDDRAVARRAIAEAAASVAPNTFCLGIDPDEDVMALHQLVRDDGPPHPADPLELR